jgi:biopolymer transport protein ExbB
MEQTWNLLRQGGPTMVPLLLCSVLALAVVLERLWMLRRARVLPRELLSALEGFFAGGDRGALREVCGRRPGPLAAVVEAALQHGDGGPGAHERVQAAGRRAVRALDRGLLLLEIVAAIAPLLGLFGTVLGMFETFQVIARQGLGDPGALSGGISEALVTTIFGLGLAIPAVVAHGYLSRRVDDHVGEIEELGEAVLTALQVAGEERPPAAVLPATVPLSPVVGEPR